MTEQERQDLIAAGALEDLEETADEIDLVAELVANEGIQAEERHEETIERIERCQSQVEELRNRWEVSLTQNPENPLLSQLLNQLVDLRAEVATLKSLLETRASTPAQSPSTMATPEAPPESRAESVTEVSTVAPSGESAPKRTSRVYRL